MRLHVGIVYLLAQMCVADNHTLVLCAAACIHQMQVLSNVADTLHVPAVRLINDQLLLVPAAVQTYRCCLCQLHSSFHVSNG
jgi:hypothetical protein